jgi:hypothetical protein
VFLITRTLVDSSRNLGGHIALMGGIGGVLSAFMNNVAALALLGPVLAYWGYSHNMTLLIIFGCLGTVLGGQMFFYCFKPQLSKKQWILEHLNVILGSGIAVYTAFFAVGARHLTEHLGDLRLLSWILPGVIGTVCIQHLSRKYRKKFNPSNDKITITNENKTHPTSCN